MKTFNCSHCGQTVFFENLHCGNCGHVLSFEPASLQMVAIEPDADQWTLCTAHLPEADDDGNAAELDARPGAWKLCANHLLRTMPDGAPNPTGVCNWMLPTHSTQSLCRSCRTTTEIPNLQAPGSLGAWQKLEGDKRRLFYGLLDAGLPVPRQPDAAHALNFRFLADVSGSEEPVLTGHAEGTITVNLAEADDATREQRRTAMHEPYRTLLGHFRHEIGHYYWDVLIAGSPFLDRYRALFGDERADYGESLQRHYEQGAPADWSEHYISAYATMHPWEDWAETWAHYMHIADGLDTAAHWGVRLSGAPVQARRVEPEAVGAATSQLDAAAFSNVLIHQWLPLARFLNSMGRSLGQGDLYPFVMPTPVVEKLAFVHEVVQRAAADHRPDAQAEAQEAAGRFDAPVAKAAPDAPQTSTTPAPPAAPPAAVDAGPAPAADTGAVSDGGPTAASVYTSTAAPAAAQH